MTQSSYNKQFAMLQNLIMILLETGFSFLLRKDPILQMQAQALIEQNAIIKINSYFPFFDLYLQFTAEGVLFDTTAPIKQPDVEFRTTLGELFKILFSGHVRSLKSMKAKGNVEIQHQFQDLLLLCTLPNVLKEFPQWFAEMPEPEQRTASEQRIAPLLESYNYQREQIAQLRLQLKQEKYAKQQAHKQTRLYKFGFFLMLILWLVMTSLYFYPFIFSTN